MSTLQGPRGRAEQVPLPDTVDASQTVVHWLITAPPYHPHWSQYVLACVRLDDDSEAFGPAKHKFEGTTHEVLLVALNPEHGPYDVEKITGYFASGNMPYLTPINIAEQFIATDAEMTELCEKAVQGLLDGLLNPETGDAPTAIREYWLTALTRTLAHIRGEVHAP